MIQLIKKGLEQIVNDIDSGNSNMSEDEQLKFVELLQKISNQELSKTEAADYIGVSTSIFRNYVDKGLIPKGTKSRGVTALFWKKYDLNKYIEKYGKHVRKRL